MIQDPLRICIFSTYISIPTSISGTVISKGKSGHIRDVLDNLREVEYNHRFRRWIVTSRFYTYDSAEGLTYLPRHVLDNVKSSLDNQDLIYELEFIEPTVPAQIEISIDNRFTDRENQIPTIQYLISQNSMMRGVKDQTGQGKALTLNTLIRIPRGWKRMGDIQVGDTVISADSTETKVTGVYPQGKLIVYRITFADGRFIDCSGDHLWEVFYVNTTVNARWRIVNTLEIIRLINMPNPRVYIRLIEPENCSDIDLPIHPYTLGVFLGDGCSKGITPKLDTPDEFIIDKLSNLLPDNVELNKINHSVNRGCFSYTIRKNDKSSSINKNEFIVLLKDLNLYDKYSYEKFIPVKYLEGSKEQRLALLGGLLDTDGYVGITGSMSYCTTSFQLAKDVQYLVHSLGGIASISTKQPHFTHDNQRKEGRLAYIVNIRHTRPSEFFTLPKKASRLNDQNQYSHKLKLQIKSVEKLPYSEEMQCISVDHPSRLYVAENFIVTHNTFMTIRAISELKFRSLIICEGNLQNQWKNEILDKTDLKEEDIYLIQGAGSLVKLFNKKYEPKIFIASIDTLRSYIVNNNPPYNLLPSYPEFLNMFGIGIKIIDEFHLNFSIIISIELRSNVKNNIYLSATPKRSSKQEEKIFNMIFPSSVIEGGKKYDRYVKVYFYKYTLEFKKQDDFNTVHGYSHIKYEQYIQRHANVRQRFVDTVIVPLVNSHFIHKYRPGYKLLIFCKTVAFCELIQAYLESKFRQFDIRTYTQKDSEDNLKEADIIVSTPQSCGTGKDITGLVTVIQTCSLGSAPLIEQILGRIRKPKDDSVTEFVDIYNKGLSRHYSHYKTRSLIYKERALTYTEHELS